MARARNHVVAVEGDLIVERDPQRPSGRLLCQADMAASYVDLGDRVTSSSTICAGQAGAPKLQGAPRVCTSAGRRACSPRALLAEDSKLAPGGVRGRRGRAPIARAAPWPARQPGLRVRVADGRAVLEARAEDSADAIVIDAFVGARVPRHSSRRGARHCARVAQLTLVNVVDTAGRRDVRAIVAALSTVYPTHRRARPPARDGEATCALRLRSACEPAAREQPQPSRPICSAAAPRF